MSKKASTSIPLDFEQALKGFLAVDPTKIPKPVKKASAKKKTAKKVTKKTPHQ